MSNSKTFPDNYHLFIGGKFASLRLISDAFKQLKEQYQVARPQVQRLV